MRKDPIEISLSIIGWPAGLEYRGFPKMVRFFLKLVLMLAWFPIGMPLFLISAPFFGLWELWLMEDENY